MLSKRRTPPFAPAPGRSALELAVKNPGAAVAAPGFKGQAKTPLRRLRAGGEGAAHKQPCARETQEAGKCAGASRRWYLDSAPLQWARLVGLRPGLLRQVVRKCAVPDAGSSLPGRHEGRFTDTPPGHAYGASTPRFKHVAACGGRGVLALVLGGWPCPCQGASR
jgi:hypothetical protein